MNEKELSEWETERSWNETVKSFASEKPDVYFLIKLRKLVGRAVIGLSNENGTANGDDGKRSFGARA